MWASAFGGAIGATAISGIEVALWDILGKNLGVPVWRLLGRMICDVVPFCTHVGLGNTTTACDTMQVEPLEERALEVPAVQATDAGCGERLRTHFRDIAPGEVFDPVTRFFGYKTIRGAFVRTFAGCLSVFEPESPSIPSRRSGSPSTP